jgi:hypothetical protein
MRDKSDIILLHHYSHIKPVKSLIIDKPEDRVLRLRPYKYDLLKDFRKDDPAVYEYEAKGKNLFESCNIEEVNFKNHSYDIKLPVDTSHINESHEKRKHKRYPVSLYSYIKIGLKKINTSFVLVRNVSREGLLIYSNNELETGENYPLNLHTKESVIFLNGDVKRSFKGNSYNQYGISLKISNTKVTNDMNYFINRLEDSFAF